MTINRARFEQQMQFLKDNDFQVIGLDRLLDLLDFKEELPPKSV